MTMLRQIDSVDDRVRRTGPKMMRGVLLAALTLLLPATSEAQGVSVRGFADIGHTTFTAKESFETILGDPGGIVFGGGGEVVIADKIFVAVRASRFEADGERVFVHNGEVFNLGIDTTIRVTPIELTGGYRFNLGWPIVPYAGAGIDVRVRHR
jgi:hypothetical protein